MRFPIIEAFALGFSATGFGIFLILFPAVGGIFFGASDERMLAIGLVAAFTGLGLMVLSWFLASATYQPPRGAEGAP